MNLSKIEQSIAKQPGTSLTLQGITRFIISENQSDYFAQLTELDLSSNKLTSLNLKGFTALQRLYCNGNLLTILNLSGFNTITDISCSNNPLRILNINDCTALETVFYPNQHLTHLTVKNCTSLLAIVPDDFAGHPLLINLNLQGASQAVDKLAELEKELIRKNLATATDEEKPELIARLAERETPTSYWDLERSNTYATWFEYQSQEEEMDEDRKTHDKRKRNDDNDGPEFKRHKPDGL